jgi:hypothetical protein
LGGGKKIINSFKGNQIPLKLSLITERKTYN